MRRALWRALLHAAALTAGQLASGDTWEFALARLIMTTAMNDKRKQIAFGIAAIVEWDEVKNLSNESH